MKKKKKEIKPEEDKKALEEFYVALQKKNDELKSEIIPNSYYPFEDLTVDDIIRGYALLDFINNAPESDTSIEDLEFKPFHGKIGLKAKRKF